jgi:hypothetical protein
LLINPELPLRKKIDIMVEEKDIFHMHKNRLFIDRLSKVVEPPLTTKQILTKI